MSAWRHESHSTEHKVRLVALRASRCTVSAPLARFTVKAASQYVLPRIVAESAVIHTVCIRSHMPSKEKQP